MENAEEKKVNVTFTKVMEFGLYIIGIIFLIIGFNYYSKDLRCGSYGVFDFYENKYVGGDAYNYIISASRSAAVMIKSLIWIVLGSCSIIIGRTFSKK